MSLRHYVPTADYYGINPCPHCNSTAVDIWSNPENPETGIAGGHVFCEECGAMTRNYNLIDQAAIVWNANHPDLVFSGDRSITEILSKDGSIDDVITSLSWAATHYNPSRGAE